jgi:hypothetical protein
VKSDPSIQSEKTYGFSHARDLGQKFSHGRRDDHAGSRARIARSPLRPTKADAPGVEIDVVRP